ncbi:MULTISPECIES: zinc ribbon domain-containing protein [Rhodococcus]|uniref:Zinc ribbon domain-containing protein n=2 Tax=Rhodococcus opacus TaxID=37919 RepID=A0AAX3YEY6_RHOOP|nr:zinc ribbon domain-containing protein [Rhodococcus opacus]NHU42499.1 transposase [Rhodococcus sp. A14]MCZ4584038.1 zinc ribbon domain-containing protein [Rhodococcus opacus]MDJ0415206.1 zinc ribbon domain-containing protein [Rhodococcus opacus]MDX5968615.1 zinc ribbon domain-containing protein [Rhodococcus opacus]NKY70718.1 transposase [Rhodococcus opacus]
MSGPGSTAARQFSVTTRAHVAVDDATGEPIGLDDVDVRVGWLLDLVAAAGAELVSRLWQPATFDVLAAGLDRQDRRLPAQGHVAAARLGWTPFYPDGVYVPSRVSRVVTAQVVATLRTLAYRDTAIAALSARFDPATGRLTAPTEPGDSVPAGFARGVRRQLAARGGGGAPAGRLRITEIQGPPQTSAMARLSAADRQLAQITVTGRELVLTVKLPTSPTPAGRAQWRSVRLTAAIPEHLHGRAVTDWHLPTLVLDGRGLLWRCAATELVPADDLDSAAVAVGVDWSPTSLGAAALVAEGADGLSSDYRGWTYDDRGLGIKLARLQTEGQLLHGKAARLTRLAAAAPPEVRARLEAKIAVLDAHRTAVGVKRGMINRELAFHFARQVTDYATAAGAQVIAVEDLTTLETRGRGRVNNNRAAQSARRHAVTALAHTAAGVGVTVVSVPARGSSAWCPGCDEPLSRPGGYHTAWCPACQVGGNRDHMAGVNLAKRALLGRSKVTRRRGRMPVVRVAEHAPVRRCRDKNGPTPSRPRHRRVRRSLPPTTRRVGVNPKQHVPAPQASVWDTVKPTPPHGDTGSRDTRTSQASAPPVADGMRST